MARCLYLAPDLRQAGFVETDRLDGAVERQLVRLNRPLLRPIAGDPLQQAGDHDVVFELTTGLATRRQLHLAGKLLNRNARVWFYWPSEGAVERLDRERWRSFRRHGAVQFALRQLDRAMRPAITLRRMPEATLWAYYGRFPVHDRELAAELDRHYGVAKPVQIPQSAWRSGGVDGAGLYLRTDFWSAITSGGSYGHTCYVARELRESSADLVCLLARRFPLLDELGVRQIEMDLPERLEGEEVIATATSHYYPIVKAACQMLRPAYIYERLCLGNYVAALLSRELGIPYIVEYNGSEISMQKSFEGAKRYTYHDLYVRAEAFAFRQATAISVVSDVVKADLVSRGVDARKILVNPNGADPHAYAPADDAQRDAIRRELGFERADRVVGFTATFGGWHGVDVLAAALPKIAAASPAVRFLLVGDGAYKPIVDDVIATHGLSDRVRAVGRVPQQEGARLLKACDIYVSPHSVHMKDSKFFGSPTKLFEYMAMGGGIVASDLEQLGEVLSPALRVTDLRHGDVAVRSERAVLCRPGDVDEFVEAVVRLVERPDLCRALGINSRRAVQDHYSWTRHVEKLWCFTRGLAPADVATTPTGEPYKDDVQKQGNQSPVGSERARTTQPHTLEWFLEIERDRYGTYAPWMRSVMEFSAHADEDVLEIGGGLGIDLAQFAANGARVTDVDLSAEHLALADEHFRLRGLHGRFVHHDAAALPFPDASFDLVYSTGAIHHAPNTQRIVDEINRVLRPGARAIVMVYAERSWNYWKEVMFTRGMCEGMLSHHSMAHILSHSVENGGTDAWPLVKVYTRRQLKRMFGRFDDVRMTQRQLRRPELPRLVRPLQPWLERVIGWNLIVKAQKRR